MSADDTSREALALVRADLRAEAMIRSYETTGRTSTNHPVFTPTDVFDIAARYTPEWVDQVLTSRREE